jgi:hypothetical protein
VSIKYTVKIPSAGIGITKNNIETILISQSSNPLLGVNSDRPEAPTAIGVFSKEIFSQSTKREQHSICA